MKLKKIMEVQFVDNKKLKEFPKRMHVSRAKLALYIAERALAFKNSKRGSKVYFSTPTPTKKYAKKYSEKELKNQIKQLTIMLKNPIKKK